MYICVQHSKEQLRHYTHGIRAGVQLVLWSISHVLISSRQGDFKIHTINP